VQISLHTRTELNGCARAIYFHLLAAYNIIISTLSFVEARTCSKGATTLQEKDKKIGLVTDEFTLILFFFVDHIKTQWV